MRLQASMSVLLASNHPDAEFLPVNESTSIERNRMGTLPPGWTPHTLNTSQPADNAGDFRREKLREVGAPASMPLMKIQHDSSNHNYSSARFDGQG